MLSKQSEKEKLTHNLKKSSYKLEKRNQQFT